MSNQDSTRPRRHRRERGSDRLLPLRNVLNAIFMLGAIIGLCVYYFSDHSVGIFIILTAMAFKMAECSLRLIR